MSDDFRVKNLQAWEAVLNDIFPFGIPIRCEWSDYASIMAVLNRIGSMGRSFNHTFLPHGGGLDITGARDSVEDEEYMELIFDDSLYEIINPKRVIFHSFGTGYYEWAYFRIEANEMPKSDVYGELAYDYEELTEIKPGQYIDRSYYDNGYFGEDPLPRSARVVTRNLKGDYAIFAKGSVYNKTNGTYDGRHNQMNDEEFRAHIAHVVERIETNSPFD